MNSTIKIKYSVPAKFDLLNIGAKKQRTCYAYYGRIGYGNNQKTIKFSFSLATAQPTWTGKFVPTPVYKRFQVGW